MALWVQLPEAETPEIGRTVRNCLGSMECHLFAPGFLLEAGVEYLGFAANSCLGGVAGTLGAGHCPEPAAASQLGKDISMKALVDCI